MAENAFFNQIEELKMPVRIAIFTGTLMVLGIAFFFLSFQPTKAAIQKTGEEIASLDRQMTKAKLKAKNLDKLKARKDLVDEQFKKALKLLPDKKEIPSLLRGITQLGSDSNLVFRRFIPRKERVRGFYYELPVSIEVSGPFHDVATFFYKVGRMERIVNINNVSMKPLKLRSTNLITKCEAVTYRFKGKNDAKRKKKK